MDMMKEAALESIANWKLWKPSEKAAMPVVEEAPVDDAGIPHSDADADDNPLTCPMCGYSGRGSDFEPPEVTTDNDPDDVVDPDAVNPDHLVNPSDTRINE